MRASGFMPLPSLDRLTQDLLAGDLASTRRLFELHRASAPQVVWSPAPEDLPCEQLRFLLRYWTEKRAAADMPPVSAIDPIEMRPALGYIMLLDVLDGGADFRYRLYGTQIVDRTGTDWTGRTVSEMAAQAYTGLFYGAIYRAVIARRQPVATITASPRYVAATQWSRIVLPLAGADGQVVRFLVGNVPGPWRQPEPAEAPVKG